VRGPSIFTIFSFSSLDNSGRAFMGAQTKYGRLYAFVFQASANGYRKSGAVIFRGANREQTARTKGTNITEREELA
jgi:hypothetical protein